MIHLHTYIELAAKHPIILTSRCQKCALVHVLTLQLLIISGLSGCALLPQPIERAQGRSLVVINTYYRQTIAEAYQHPRHRWHHGRTGNMIVNLAGEPHLGLCYHWQILVYNGIKPALAMTGWEAVGIASNEGTGREHHAVLIYDPDKHQLQHLLSGQNDPLVYVLDPWPTGTAAIYSLTQWLQWREHDRSKARLTIIKENKEIE